MATIADLMVKISGDGSGLSKELNKTQANIQSAFTVNPVNEFTSAMSGATGQMGSFISKVSSFAALAAGGFGLATLVEKAVDAGESVYQLSNRMHISSAEAVDLNRILSLTGGNTDSFSTAMMRLDKSFEDSGESGKKTRATLAAFGVSLTDSSGKMLPLNQQLVNLSKGYKTAASAGLQQEFLMNTLGARELSLVSTLNEYSEAAEAASKVKGIGLNQAEMHELDIEMKVLSMQASQIGLAFASAFAPIAKELFPPIMSGLQRTATFLAQNKDGVVSLTKEVLEMAVAYKAASVVWSIGGAISSGWKTAAAQVEASMAATGTATATLNAKQEAAIARSVAASNKGYAKMEDDAVKAAIAEGKSSDETAAIISKNCAAIAEEGAATAEKIRLSMTEAFLKQGTAAKESAQVVSAAFVEEAEAVEVAAEKIAAAGEASATGAEAAIVSQGELTVVTAETGNTAAIAGEKEETANLANAESADVAAVAQEELAIATSTAGNAATVAGGKAAAGNLLGANAAKGAKVAQVELTVAEVASGTAAVTTGGRIAGAMATAGVAVRNLLVGVLALAGGWELVLFAAIAYSSYKLYNWAKTRQDVPGYDPDVPLHKELKPEYANQAYSSYQDQDGFTHFKKVDHPESHYHYTVDKDGGGRREATPDEMIRARATWAEAEKNKGKTPQEIAEAKEAEAKAKMDKELEEEQAKDKELQDKLNASMAGLNNATQATTKAEERRKSVLDEASPAVRNALVNAAHSEGVDPELLGAIAKQESSFGRNKTSPAGARGLMQIMPFNFQSLGITNPDDDNQSAHAGAKYIKQMLNQFGGDVRLALAAYNAGPRAVGDLTAKYGKNYDAIQPHLPGETREYVSKVTGFMQSGGKYESSAEDAEERRLEDLQRKAAEINADIAKDYAAMTNSKLDDVNDWYAGEKAKLDESHEQNQHYTAALAELEAVKADKLRRAQAEELASIVDFNADAKKLMDDTADSVAEAGLVGIDKQLSDIEKEHRDKLESIQKAFVDLSLKYQGMSLPDQKKQRDAWDAQGVKYTLGFGGGVDLSPEKDKQVNAADDTKAKAKGDLNLTAWDAEVKYHNDLLTLNRKTAAEVDALNLQTYNNEIGYLNSLMRQQIAAGQEGAQAYQDTLSKLAVVVQAKSEIMGRSLASSYTVAIQNIKSQQVDFAKDIEESWGSIDSSVKGHIEGIVTGSEGFVSGLKSMILDVSKSIAKMFADRFYNADVYKPLQDKFTNIFKSKVDPNANTQTDYNLPAALGGGTSASTQMSAAAATLNVAGGLLNTAGTALLQAAEIIGATKTASSAGGLLGGLLGGTGGGILGGGNKSWLSNVMSKAPTDSLLGGFGLTGVTPASPRYWPSLGAMFGLAEGGIVTGPTLAQIGEGFNKEAVIPLTNNNLNRIGIGGNGGQQPVQVVMHINTNDAQSFRKSQAQILGELTNAVMRGRRNT